MPYENPPDKISDLSKKKQKAWVKAFNNAWEDYPNVDTDKSREGYANAIAWTAVKKVEGGEDKLTKNTMKEEKGFAYSLKMNDEIGGDMSDTTEVQVMPTGEWEHPSYGEIELNGEDLQKFKQHFEQEIRKGVPITAGHAKPGEEKPAVGWFKKLINKGSEGLWGVVEWTEKGKELLKDKAFKYFSPEFHNKYEDPETHETYENVLVGGALTNKPYFKGLKGVALSEVFTNLNTQNMSDEEKKEEEVEEEEEEKVEADEEEPEEEEEEEEKEEVDADEEEEEEEAVEASESAIKIDASEYQALKNKAEQGYQAKKELEEKRLSEFADEYTMSEDGGVFKPKAKDGLKDFLRTLDKKQIKQFEEVLKGVPEPKMFEELGDDEGEEPEPQEELDSKVEKKMSENDGLKYADAVREVTRENSQLADKLSE